EIYDYLRLLYARIGIPHCPVCGREISQQSIDEITDQILALPEGTKIQLLAPIVRGRKGQYLKELEQARKSGYVRVRIDGIVYDLSEEIKLDKNLKHTIEIVVDRLVIKEGILSRLTDSLETVTSLTGGIIHVDVINGEMMTFSQNYACPEHNISMEELTPRMFSFNNPYGACEKCTGLGMFQRIDPDLIVPNPELSILDGAIHASGWNHLEEGSIAMMYYEALAKKYNISLETPFAELLEEVTKAFLYGTNGEKLELKRSASLGGGTYTAPFEGVINNLERRYQETTSVYSKADLEDYMNEVTCKACKGARLKPEILAVTVGGLNIYEFTELSVRKELEFLKELKLTEHEKFIAERIIKEIQDRLNFLSSVGLEYLTLARASGTLSGGESQRIRLATQIGSSLMGVLYILDEPSIGLHQRDNAMLIETMKHLRDIGNTLIVVEHDDDTILAADYVIDIGKGAGIHGGNVIFSGTPEELLKCEESITGQYLSGKKTIPVPKIRRTGNGNFLTVKGASEHNLKNLTVQFSLGKFICVTGVSGSGKSSLINEILYKHLAAKLNRAKIKGGQCKSIEGLENLDKVICIDQSPIGRTPRSNPATYTGVFTDIRNLFAQTNAAKAHGYNASRFSFNVKGGRCEACEGDGILKIEMHFLPDIYVPCEVCKGKRYNRETLEVHYKDKSIYDILEMTVEEGVLFFEHIPKIAKRLQTLQEVGLGYIKIGQPATTLSGGEAQRVKLATELSKKATGKTVYILDEPTTGLHTADVHKLIEVLQKLVDTGNTVIVIEHNMHVIKTADEIIDLGREGGDNGGTIVAQGTPEEVAEIAESYTGAYLKPYLEQ
ncbi:MAG: excinuclease ABC subunit UvrA, partial [Oscillospiraceae bacterium]|nr:excinuclease ABC subunit UvrA [Oscillospiraceae bacterium]